MCFPPGFCTLECSALFTMIITYIALIRDNATNIISPDEKDAHILTYHSAGPTDPPSHRGQPQFFLYRLDPLIWTQSSRFFLWYSSSIKDSLHNLKFLHEKNGRCEKYMTIKKFTDTICGNTSCICLFGPFTLAALANNKISCSSSTHVRHASQSFLIKLQYTSQRGSI